MPDLNRRVSTLKPFAIMPTPNFQQLDPRTWTPQLVAACRYRPAAPSTSVAPNGYASPSKGNLPTKATQAGLTNRDLSARLV
ncbi:MAG TPA: hypothetical protein VIF81_04320 [Pyrinomonadaceae bacterium]